MVSCRQLSRDPTALAPLPRFFQSAVRDAGNSGPEGPGCQAQCRSQSNTAFRPERTRPEPKGTARSPGGPQDSVGGPLNKNSSRHDGAGIESPWPLGPAETTNRGVPATDGGRRYGRKLCGVQTSTTRLPGGPRPSPGAASDAREARTAVRRTASPSTRAAARPREVVSHRDPAYLRNQEPAGAAGS